MSVVPAKPPAGKPDLAPDRKDLPRAWWILAIVLGATTMNTLDGTVVNVAIPSIKEDLHTSDAAMQWIVGGYALAFAVALIAGGRLGDIHGRRRMFRLGIIGFTITSLGCGLAPTTNVLVVMRLLQGFSAAMMIPHGFGLIREVFAQDNLAKALSFWGPSAAIGALLGPVVGGLLIGLDAFGTGWRGVFFINVPIGIVLLLGAGRLLPRSPNTRKDGDSLDVAGALIMGIAIGLIFFPLIEGRDLDWPAWTFAMFAAGFALIGFFGWFERRRGEQGKPQLILLTIFSHPSYVGGSILVMLLFTAFTGLLLVLSLYLQLDQGFSAIHAALTIIPLSIGTAAGAITTGMVLLPKLERRVLHLGILIAVIGFIVLEVVLRASGSDITNWDLVGPLLIIGIGFGLVISPSYNFAMSVVEFRELGSGSGVLNSTQQLGTAAGVAALGTIFFAITDTDGMLVALERTVYVDIAIAITIGALIFMLPTTRKRVPS